MTGLALIEAAKVGDLDAARRAIETGADLKERDAEKGYPPLIWAARNGHVGMVRLLIEEGADIEQADREPSPEHVRQLLAAGVDPDSQSGTTAVARAAYNGHFGVVKVLVDSGADLLRHYYGETALHSSVEGGSKEIVEYLLDNGAEINTFHRTRGTPLALAARCGRADIVRLLIDRGADLDKQDESDIEGFTPLMAVVELATDRVVGPDAPAHCVNIARMLVEAGADLGARSASGWTALDMCDLHGPEFGDTRARATEMKSAIRAAASRRRVRGLLQRIGLGKLIGGQP